MPVAVRSKTNATRSNKSSPEASSSSTKLRSITPEEAHGWSKTLASRSHLCNDLYDLDEPVEYPFKVHDRVWVRTKKEKWCQGRVSGQAIRVGQTRHQKQGLFYPVNFGSKYNLRKYFAPMNGEIKPDTKSVRRILAQEGWIEAEEIEDDYYATDSSGDFYTE